MTKSRERTFGRIRDSISAERSSVKRRSGEERRFALLVGEETNLRMTVELKRSFSSVDSFLSPVESKDFLSSVGQIEFPDSVRHLGDEHKRNVSFLRTEFVVRRSIGGFCSLKHSSRTISKRFVRSRISTIGFLKFHSFDVSSRKTKIKARFLFYSLISKSKRSQPVRILLVSNLS